jgi:large conductance mechanosensitive channel
MFGDFKKFIARGNVIDMAVGIIIGAAFATVVKSLVDDVIMPPIGLLINGVNFSDLFIILSGEQYTTLAEAKEAGAATINYGLFLSNLLTFLIVAFATFMLVEAATRLQRREELAPSSPTEMVCPHCLFKVPVGAHRCGHCTQELRGVVV